jgi:hypothetical protein
MKKHLTKFVIAILLAGTFPSTAQTLSPQVIASAGGYSTVGNVSLSWTLGETFTTTLENGNSILTQGFQQPFIRLRILNLKAFLQGYYLGGGTMQPVLLNQAVAGATSAETDTITIELRDDADPGITVASAVTLLMTDGSASATFEADAGNYWVVIKHRNSVQTWTPNPIAIPSSYDFTVAANKAFGDNMTDPFSENIWSFYTSDINQDEFIDIFDFPFYDADNQAFVLLEYAATDLNGDGFVDIFDFPIYDANNQAFVFSLHP